METATLTTAVPATGLGAVLVVLLGYLIKLIADNYARAADADKRAVEAHERAELAQLQVDEERKLRREAEARAAVAEAKADAQQFMLDWHAKEREHLRGYLPPQVAPGVLPDPPGQEGS